MIEGGTNIEGNLTSSDSHTSTADFFNKAQLEEHVRIQKMLKFVRKWDEIDESVVFRIKNIRCDLRAFRVMIFSWVKSLTSSIVYLQSTLFSCRNFFAALLYLSFSCAAVWSCIWSIRCHKETNRTFHLVKTIAVIRPWEISSGLFSYHEQQRT